MRVLHQVAYDGPSTCFSVKNGCWTGFGACMHMDPVRVCAQANTPLDTSRLGKYRTTRNQQDTDSFTNNRTKRSRLVIPVLAKGWPFRMHTNPSLSRYPHEAKTCQGIRFFNPQRTMGLFYIPTPRREGEYFVQQVPRGNVPVPMTKWPLLVSHTRTNGLDAGNQHPRAAWRLCGPNPKETRTIMARHSRGGKTLLKLQRVDLTSPDGTKNMWS